MTAGTQKPPRRGAALLVVLATLIVAVTASATLARLASSAKADRAFAKRALVGDDLLRALEAPIQAWLTTDSSEVVLPPDVTIPRVDLLHDSWVSGATEYEMHVSAWDQCGMAPIEAARSGSPLRLGLPEEVKSVLDRVKIPNGQTPGLDFFTGREWPPRINAFARSSDSHPVVFGQSIGEEPTPGVEPPPEAFSSVPPAPAVGAYVATHNPRRINVNTAPIELVEAALRLAGRGGLDLIIESRREGRPANVGELPQHRDPQRTAPSIAASSRAWAFRIEIRIGPLRRSWWAVYAQSGSAWECVQRLAITE